MKGHGKKKSLINASVLVVLLTHLIIACNLPEGETNQKVLGKSRISSIC
jgi:hypothetical protein